MSGLVRARALRRRFRDGDGSWVEAVRDASLDLDPGEVLLIQGPSGSGKTTLLSLLGGIVTPDAGRIEVAGVDLVALGERGLPDFRLRHVGLVFQSFHLLDALTVAENVELPLSLARWDQREARKRSRTLLERFGLDGRAEARPTVLSAGERQRVAVARALALDPPVLLADEPTGSLDAVAGNRVMDALCDAAQGGATGVLVVSHDDRLRSRADRVTQMVDGRLHDGLDATCLSPA